MRFRQAVSYALPHRCCVICTSHSQLLMQSQPSPCSVVLPFWNSGLSFQQPTQMLFEKATHNSASAAIYFLLTPALFPSFACHYRLPPNQPRRAGRGAAPRHEAAARHLITVIWGYSGRLTSGACLFMMLVRQSTGSKHPRPVICQTSPSPRKAFLLTINRYPCLKLCL